MRILVILIIIKTVILKNTKSSNENKIKDEDNDDEYEKIEILQNGLYKI